MTTIYVMILVTTLILVCTVIPYYALVIFAMILAFFVAFYFYFPAAQFLKYQTGAGNASMFSHLSESLTGKWSLIPGAYKCVGIVIVRAFGQVERFDHIYLQKIDRAHKFTFNLDQLQLWLSFRMDFVASLLVFVTCIFAVVEKGQINPSYLGLAISNSFQKLLFFSLVVKGVADITTQVPTTRACLELISRFRLVQLRESTALLM
jgi:hypothetical protein